MTITEAMRAVSDDYNGEVAKAAASGAFAKMMSQVLIREYDEIDPELVDYVVDIANSMGVPGGTILPSYVYQIARMAFRMGMRTQRKLDRPEQASSTFWRTDGPVA
jgi:hypothetical protein